MATYQGNNYASDVYLQDTSSGAITRAAELGVRVDQSLSWDNWDGWTESQSVTYKKAVFVYANRATGMEKKRRTGKASGPYIYISAFSAGGSGSPGALAPGSVIDNYLLDKPYTFNGNLNVRSEYKNYALSDLSLNAYNNCTKFRTNEVYANKGATGQFGQVEGYLNGYALITIQSHLGANKPYIVENYEDVVPFVSNPYPTSGFVSDASPATFGWTFAYDASNVAATLTQGSAKFRWREVGDTEYTEVPVSGAQNSIVIPSGTFTATNIEWQVVVTSDDGIESAPSAWYQFTVVDFVSTANPINPVNKYVKVDNPVVFKWEHVIESGTEQTKADLEYAVDGGPWQALATVTGAEQTVTIAANALPAGRIQWRVRTYNVDDVVGAWSNPATFIGIGTPQPPSLTSVTNNMRPTIRWQALGQVAYEVRILREGSTGYIYETGQVSGADKLHHVTKHLHNGNYTAYVRILNATLWSDWSGIGFTISATPPLAPTITAEQVTNGAKVIIPPVASAHTYLHRNGVPVAEITGLSEYIDYAALGFTEYSVRVIDDADSFADSNTVAVTVTVDCPRLAAVDDLHGMVALKLTRGNPRNVGGNFSIAAGLINCAGRKDPLVEFSEFENEQYQVPVAFLATGDRDALLTLMRRRKTLLYRDNWGNRWYVVALSTTLDQDRTATSMAVQLTVASYVEAIDYAGV